MSLIGGTSVTRNQFQSDFGKSWENLTGRTIYWFSSSHSLSSPCFVLAAVVVTQIRFHIACASRPPPHCTARALHILSREDFSRFFPRQLAPNCTYPRSQEMIPFFFENSHSHPGGIRTAGSTLLLLMAFEDKH